MRYMKSTIALAAALLLAQAGLAAPETQTIVSPARRVSLLELYTSEGCSSCPPAEDWLAQWVDDPRLWTTLVPVNFHVDYWDYLGWRDPFDSPAYTERQAMLAAHDGHATVYTPGFVLNGTEWSDWFNHRPLLLDTPPAGRLQLRSSGRAVAVRYAPLATLAPPLEIHVVLLAFGVDVPVATGENGGRSLRHDFLVVSYAHSALPRRDADYETRVQLPVPVSVKARRYALAAWISSRDDPTPLQAAGGWLAAAP